MTCKSLRALLLGTAITVIGGCAATEELWESSKKAWSEGQRQAQENRNGGAQSSTSGGPASPGYKRLIDTELNNVFASAPYESADPASSWPRVALRVLSSPASHKKNAQFLLAGEDACYDLTATLWQAPGRSDEHSFRWCYRNDVVYDVAFREVFSRATRPILFDAYFSENNTGKKRTTGPNPPKTIMPDDVRHKSFVDYSGLNINQVMVGSLMFQMGYDWTSDPDHRLWFIRFDGIDKVAH